MRVIAGSRKGHKLAAPRGLDTRPTSDRVRENIFNLVGPVDGARVLDLFAGSGALGIEALSRGAASAVFVEHEADAVRTIERNLDRVRLTGARVVHGDVLRTIAQEVTAGAKYDLVLVDPPYGMLTEIQPRLARHLPPLLAADGLLVVETDARTEPELPLPVRTSRKYGQTRVTLFEASSRVGSTEPPGSGGAGMYGPGAGNSGVGSMEPPRSGGGGVYGAGAEN